MNFRLALQYMLISTLSFAIMNAFVKYLVHLSPFQLVFFRSLGSLLLTMSFLLKNKIPILGNQRKLLVLRGFVGVTSMTLFFMALKYLPIGTAVSLRYIAPIFAVAFAVLFLGEKVRPLQWLFFFTSFLGVVVLKGFDAQVDNTGLFLVIGSSLFSGLVYTIISKIGKGDHPVVVVNYFMMVATLIGGTLAVFNWVQPKGWDWVLLGTLGILGYFGQVYMTKAFQTAASNQVAPLKYVEVIFTGSLGVFWFNEVYTIYTILGIFLIIGGLVLNALYRKKN